MYEQIPLILFGCLIIGLVVIACLLVAIRKLSHLNSRIFSNEEGHINERRLQHNLPSPQSALSNDLVIEPIDSIGSIKEAELPSEIGLTLEPIIRSIPAIANIAASSGKLFRITFSPEVAKGLADGSLTMMRAGSGFRATAVDSTGKIVGNGIVTLDRAVSSVAVVSAVWQILSVVTAQKFLSDINNKLASIEESVKRLETWLDTQEQGEFLGNMKYISEVSRSRSKTISADDSLLIRGQLEKIYHESLQSIEANLLRADNSFAELLNKKFDGNLMQNETAFRLIMEAYFVANSYAIRFKLTAALSECIATYAERKSNHDMGRLDSIIQGSEILLEKIKNDSKKMKEKAADISGGWFDGDEKITAKRKSLQVEMKTLLAFCEESISRVQAVRDDAKRIGLFIQEIETNGVSIIAEIDPAGKVTRVLSETVKKAG